jgi:hypothetical protein
MHPDATLHRLADLVIAALGTNEGPHTAIARRKAVELAADVVTRRLTSTVIPFPGKPGQPQGAA